VDFGGLVKRRILVELPAAQEALGRPIGLGRVRLKLLPRLELELSDLSLQAQPGQSGLLAQPLLRIGALRIRVALLPLIGSLGHRVEVTSFELSDVQLQLVRTKDGRLSYKDVFDKLAGRPPGPPLRQEEIDRLGGLILHKVALHDASASFYDLETAAETAPPLRLHHIEFSAEEAQLFQPFSLTLEMAALAAQPNLHLGLTIGPFPRDLRSPAPFSLLRRAELSLQPIEVEPLLRFLPAPAGIAIARGKIEATLKLETPASAGQLRLSADVGARGLVLSQGPPGPQSRRGEPVDVRFLAQLIATPLAGQVKVDKLELTVNDMAVSAQADLSDLWTTPAIDKLSISSRGLLLERLIATLPQPALPPDAVVRGPLSLRGAASGPRTAAKVELLLDLTQATLLLPVLRKAEGTPLSLELQGRLRQGGADIDRLGLLLGELALSLKGRVGAGDDTSVELESGPLSLARLREFLPKVEHAAPPPGGMEGDLRVSGTLRKQPGGWAVDADLALSEARLERGELSLRGQAAAHGSLAGVDLNLAGFFGRASAELVADGQGQTVAELVSRLHGTLELGLTHARFPAAPIHAKLVNPLLQPLLAKIGQPVASEKAQNAEKRELRVKSLSAKLRIDGGRVHTMTPLRLDSEDGRLSLSGSMGLLDKSVGLTGNLEVAPGAIAAATAGRFYPDVAIPVAFRIGGKVGAPQVEILELGRTVGALVGALLRSHGKKFLQELGRRRLGGFLSP
jgi:hypothetical protein